MVHCGEMTAIEQKNLTKRDRNSIIIMVIFTFVISVLIPYLLLLWRNVDFSANIDASVINGILTGTAIVFGFVTFELREVSVNIPLRIALSFPLLIFLFITVITYSFSAMFYIVDNMTLFIASSNFLFNIIYYGIVASIKDTYNQKK